MLSCYNLHIFSTAVLTLNSDLDLSKCTIFLLFVIFSAQQHMLSALYAIARPSVRLSVTWVDQSKMVEVRIMHFHHTIAPFLCFWRYKFHPEIPTGSPRVGASNNGGLRPYGKQSIFVVLTLSLGGYRS